MVQMNWFARQHKEGVIGNSLAVQWLGLGALTARGPGLIPGWGAKIPHASWPGNQHIKRKQYGNKLNKDLKKKGPYLKKKSKKRISFRFLAE